MNIATGDIVACFINSHNGPNIFPLLCKNIVGDMQPVFEWLSGYDKFDTDFKPASPEALEEFFETVAPPKAGSEKAIALAPPISENDLVSAHAMQRAGFVSDNTKAQGSEERATNATTENDSTPRKQ